jgi:inhibitor of KinA
LPEINYPGFGFRYASDRSLFVDFEQPAQIARFVRWWRTSPIEGVLNLHPAYRSVLVVFDPVRTDEDTLRREFAAARLQDMDMPDPRLVEIPVRYAGPDLEDVAAYHAITPERVIELHSGAKYTVSFLGFVPGFAYLSGLPKEIAIPRLETPRTHVPAGSVGIAGEQTGIYPFITPGGWRVIGHTDVKMFETNREPMSLLDIGDRVRFVRI